MNKIKQLYLKFKFKLIHAMLQRYDLEVADLDEDSCTFLVNFDEGACALVSLEDNGRIIRLENTIIFEERLANLKTLSSIAHAAFCMGFSVTGISAKSPTEVKIYIAKDMDFAGLLTRFKRELNGIKECIHIITGYLYYRSGQLNANMALDLSMFEDIDLFMFDPKTLGEKKEFVYQNWDNYITSVLNDDVESLIDPVVYARELQACAEFEQANGLLLSEVGNEILEELIWNRKFTELFAEDEYSIN